VRARVGGGSDVPGIDAAVRELCDDLTRRLVAAAPPRIAHV